MQMIEYLAKNPTFIPDINEVQASRETFHIGKVIALNDDLTCDIKSAGRSAELTGINSMLSNEEKMHAGSCVLYRSSTKAHKTQVEILGRSPWLTDI